MSNPFGLQNQDLSSTSSFIFSSDYGHDTILFWNVQGPVTGTLPTLTFTLQEVDPSDQVTPIGQVATSPTINSTGVGHVVLTRGISCYILVTYTLGGSTPFFGNVSASLSSPDSSVM